MYGSSGCQEGSKVVWMLLQWHRGHLPPWRRHSAVLRNGCANTKQAPPQDT